MEQLFRYSNESDRSSRKGIFCLQSSWNGREPKYDIRSFSPNREKCGKGITLNADEAAALLKALQKELNSGD